MTAPLTLLDDPQLLREVDGEDHVPVGFFWPAPPPGQTGGYYTEAAGDFLVNLKDAINVRNHPDSKRLNGCCGLDGCDGRNTVCSNGHEVGTERSDCWMAHSLALDPNRVELRTVD